MRHGVNLKKSGPKILICDVELMPLEVFAWGIYDQNPGTNMLKTDWSILSWAAKWHGDKKVFYADVRNQKNKRDDKKILKGIWKLLDKADVVIWQNGDPFDGKKLNARFVLNEMKPPSGYRTIDTKKLAKKSFGFTSNSLEYMAERLNKKYKKSKHKKFVGFDLWRECMNGNLAAFKEMEKYNKLDVLATEELYDTIQAWHQPIDFNVFDPGRITNKCNCGSANLVRWGFRYTNGGKFQRYKCQNCGADHSDSGQANNALSKEKRQGLKRKVT